MTIFPLASRLGDGEGAGRAGRHGRGEPSRLKHVALGGGDLDGVQHGDHDLAAGVGDRD